MKDAMFNLEYGLFILTAHEEGKDNGCITNSVMQISSGTPQTIAVSVNKQNYTHDMITRTKLLNVNILTTEVPMEVIKHFGFQSGRNIDKFENCQHLFRTENGLMYIPVYTNSVISGKVVNIIDCGTHSLFIADVTEKKTISDAPSATYTYYQQNIKPKPAAPAAKTSWRCEVCGYVYEGEELPKDFVCPLCKHGVEDFVKVSN